MTVTVHHGDSRDVLRSLADCSIDSVVTDPPYALVSIVKRFGGKSAAPTRDGDVYSRASAGFMGQTWDTGEVAFDPAFWSDVLRVLKPGGHLLAFSGTRTYHRLVTAIEDAGFEIRDRIRFECGGETRYGALWDSLNDEQRGALLELLNDQGLGSEIAWTYGSGFPKSHNQRGEWEGWGTALKPAHEPICVARAPLAGTVAANLVQHGTGALNIDACRIEGGVGGLRDGEESAERRYADRGATNYMLRPGPRGGDSRGRWPPNVIYDGSADVIAEFPSARARGDLAGSEPSEVTDGIYGEFTGRRCFTGYGDGGSAARFFYSAKADATDRLGSRHPTVKPIALMAYLCRLVTPPGGVVLDPFAGSGSTGLGAMREGFDAVLIEREAEYVADIHRRVAWARGEGALTAQARRRRPGKSDTGLALFADGEARS